MTTAYTAKKTNRNFLMIEKENKYIEFGLKRLENVRLILEILKKQFLTLNL